MFRSRLAVLSLLFALAASTASAHDQAHRVYHEGVEHLRRIVTHCHRAQAQIVRECTPEIRRLLRAGKYQEAREVATRCFKRIDETTERCTHAIDQLCRNVVERLQRLGADHLARHFRQLCRQAKRKVHQSADRAKAAIRELFG